MGYEARRVGDVFRRRPSRFFGRISGKAASRSSSVSVGSAGVTRRNVFLALLVGSSGAAFGPNVALAHSRLVRSDPSARAVLAAAPREIKLWFNEQVEPAFAKIWIAAGEGEKIPLSSRGDPSDKNLLIATLTNDLPEGPVVVGFRVLSVDGHVIESELKFSIKKPA